MESKMVWFNNKMGLIGGFRGKLTGRRFDRHTSLKVHLLLMQMIFA